VVDSVVSIGPITQWATVFFASSDNTFDATDVAAVLLPHYGSWSLNASEGKLTFTCIENRFWSCTAGSSGEWVITKYARLTASSEGMTLQRNITLNNNRKVKQEIVLAIY
jgi:hypothetical protein